MINFRNSLYDAHMQNWLRYFPLSQILILNGNLFRGNPLIEVSQFENCKNFCK